jgi:hypothetical protein
LTAPFASVGWMIKELGLGELKHLRHAALVPH